MNIAIHTEAIEEARKRTTIGDKFVAKAEALGMEEADWDDLIELYKEVEDEELK